MGVARGTVGVPRALLPAVVREGLVGLRHAVRVLALAHRGAAALGGVHQLVRQTERHGLLASVARGLDDPAHGERLAARGPHFDGHLVAGAADAAGLHLDHGLHVIEGRGEHLDGFPPLLAGLFGDAVEGTVDDALGGRLLAVLHDDVHELGKHLVVELRVREDGADRSLSSTGHAIYPLFLCALGAVLGPTLLALAGARTIQRAAHGVIAHTGQILHAAATDEYYRVLLQIVALAADVAGDFVAVGEAHAAHLAQRGIGLLRCRGIHARAHPAFLRGRAERRHLGFFRSRPARLPDELTRRRHRYPVSKISAAGATRAISDLRRTPGRLCKAARYS